MTILLTAQELITGDRKDSYGDTTLVTASLWSAYLKTEITPAQVCLCMALLKIARESHKHKQDNLIDAAGYIALADKEK